MRIFIASGAPRRDGYTEELARLFAEGATAAGAAASAFAARSAATRYGRVRRTS